MRPLWRYIQAFLKLRINFNFSLTTKAGSIHKTPDWWTKQESRKVELRTAPGRCVRATKTCHAIHLGKTRRRFPWSSGGGHRDLGPDPQQQPAPPSPRETEIVNTSDTLLSTVSSCFYTTTVSGNFLKSSTKLTRYPADYKFHCSSQLNLNRTILKNR